LVWTDETHYSHWPNQQANWLGQWNNEANKYDYIDHANVKRSVDICEGLLKKWGSHPAFAAFEPVNEPWWSSDWDTLK